MAKREDSEAAQHETYPGTGPGTGPRKDAQSDSGIHPVEQMVDAAIDRLARQYREREVERSSVEDESQRVARGSQSPRAESARVQASSAIVTEAAAVERRLRWRGLDVSDDFHQYAQRIARGEKLPPYSGQVLAQPDPRFPWQPGGRTTPSRRGRVVLYTLCASSVLVAFGIVWAAALRFENRARPLQTEVVAAIQVTPKEIAASPASDSSELPRTEATAPPAAVAVSAPVAEVPPQPAVPTASVTEQVPQAPPRYVPRPSPNTSPAPPRNVAPPPGDLRAALGELLRPNGLEAESAATPAATSSVATSAAVTSPAVAAPVAKSPGPAPAAAAPQVAPAPPPRADVAAARKEPGSESSAKGSLLVETPSF